jgi:uridine phosphorylase
MPIRKGITLTLDVFFAGVEEIPHQKYKRAGVLAVEMEIAALYVVAALRGARAGAIVALDGYADADLAAEYDPHTDVVAAAVEREIDIALSAIVDLAARG